MTHRSSKESAMTTPHRVEPHAQQFLTVNGKRMAYVELGSGEPVFLFLHGNPTSSYLWRNVMPEVAKTGRCVAPDLIGMGVSDKLEHPGPDSYRFTTHRGFLWGFIEAAIGRDSPLVLVGHDWGSALGFDWANHHRDRVRGIVYMEAIVRPLSWREWPESSRWLFQGFRSAAGEELVLDKNMFVERVLSGSILRTLEPAEMTEYRRPFTGSREDRWPTLAWQSPRVPARRECGSGRCDRQAETAPPAADAASSAGSPQYKARGYTARRTSSAARSPDPRRPP
jgi:haloalkane dehalogenase